MRVEIDLRIIFLILLFSITSQAKIYLLFFLFIFLHELAHILVGKMMGMEVNNISLSILGFSAQIYYYGEERILSKIVTYLAGPICNFLLALTFSILHWNIQLVQINLALGFLNLIPILPLDGGRILKEVIKYFFNHKIASIFMVEFTKYSLILISFIYSIAILKLKNIAILFLILYLWWLYCIENKKVQTLKRVYGIIEKSIEKKLV